MDEAVASGLGFEHALEAIKADRRVRRAGWNGKGMWVALSPGGTIPANLFWSAHNRAFADTQPEQKATVHPYITMKTADNQIVPWLCSQTDMLAEDWEILK